MARDCRVVRRTAADPGASRVHRADARGANDDRRHQRSLGAVFRVDIRGYNGMEPGRRRAGGLRGAPSSRRRARGSGMDPLAADCARHADRHGIPVGCCESSPGRDRRLALAVGGAHRHLGRRPGTLAAAEP